LGPLLAASAARVDVGGAPALDGLSLATTGERVLVLGAARALFEAAAGQRPVSRGTLRVEGLEPLAAVRQNVVASVPLDPPMPPAWTVEAYVTWSARLAGHSRREATERAGDALELVQGASSARAKLKGATLALRRATVLAAALATGAATLLVEDPGAGLPDEAARLLVRRVARALAGRRAVVFAGRLALESPLSLAADEALVLEGSEVAAQGAPAEVAASDGLLSLRVEGDAAAFARAVEGRGGHARVGPGALGPSARVEVRLGPLSTRDLLEIATGTQALIVELCPVARAFA
jgi:ABC-2 type transport system ATP-binding protein